MEILANQNNKLKPVDILQSTLQLIRTSSAYRERYHESVKRIKRKRAMRINKSNSGFNFVNNNKMTPYESFNEKLDRISKQAVDQDSKIIKANIQKKLNYTTLTARKIVEGNKTDIKVSRRRLLSHLKIQLIKSKNKSIMLLKAIYMYRILEFIKNGYYGIFKEYCHDLELRVAIQRIMNVIQIHLRLVSISKENRGLRSLITYVNFTHTLLKVPSAHSNLKSKCSAVVVSIMKHYYNTLHLNRNARLYFKCVMILKKKAKLFITLHRQRLSFLDLYWNKFIMGYKQAIIRFKLQAFVSILESNIKTYENIPM